MRSIYARHDVTLGFCLTLLQQELFYRQTLIGPLQRVSLVPGQVDDDCTVGEVREGTTLIGFPGDDVRVTAI